MRAITSDKKVLESRALANRSAECLLLDDSSIMYGYNTEDSKMHLFNYYILLGKRHIFPQRIEFKLSSFVLFLEFVKGKLIVQRPILYNGQKAKFLSL